MKIVTIGLGYIGLPTAVMFANNGHNVVGVDIKEEAVHMLNQGQLHIEEPGLRECLHQAIEAGRFKAQLTVEEADVFIIAVPTPNKEDAYKSCDLTHVLDAVNATIPYLREGNTLIIESTIAPRTMEDFIAPLIKTAGFDIGRSIFLVHCPERVLPGKILHELKYNNRIIGGITSACTEAGKAVYSSFVEGELITTSASEAELSKLIENTYRDVNIALANELVQIGDKLGINALEVIEMANKHPRVNIHAPGPGVGGHCLAVDPYFIVASAPEVTPLIQAARKVNTAMPAFIIQKVHALMQEINGSKITILGVAYKGNVDDIRESPALTILEQLVEANRYELAVFDPYVKASWIESDLDRATTNSDLLLVLTDHSNFRFLTKTDLKAMKQTCILDTKNIISDKIASRYVNLGTISAEVERQESLLQ